MKHDMPRAGFRIHDNEPWGYQSFLCEMSRSTLLVARSSMMKERTELMTKLRSGNLSEDERCTLANSTIWELEQEIDALERLIGIPPKEFVPDPRHRIIFHLGDVVRVRQRPTLGYPANGKEGKITRMVDTNELMFGSWMRKHPIQVEFDVSKEPAGTNDFTAGAGTEGKLARYWFAATDIEHVDPALNDRKWE